MLMEFSLLGLVYRGHLQAEGFKTSKTWNSKTRMLLNYGLKFKHNSNVDVNIESDLSENKETSCNVCFSRDYSSVSVYEIRTAFHLYFYSDLFIFFLII